MLDSSNNNANNTDNNISSNMNRNQYEPDRNGTVPNRGFDAVLIDALNEL